MPSRARVLRSSNAARVVGVPPITNIQQMVRQHQEIAQSQLQEDQKKVESVETQEDMQQEEDDEAVYQQVFGQPREEYVEDFSPDDDQDEQISASLQQAHLKPNSRRKADRVSLMDKRY